MCLEGHTRRRSVAPGPPSQPLSSLLPPHRPNPPLRCPGLPRLPILPVPAPDPHNTHSPQNLLDFQNPLKLSQSATDTLPCDRKRARWGRGRDGGELIPTDRFRPMAIGGDLGVRVPANTACGGAEAGEGVAPVSPGRRRETARGCLEAPVGEQSVEAPSETRVRRVRRGSVVWRGWGRSRAAGRASRGPDATRPAAGRSAHSGSRPPAFPLPKYGPSHDRPDEDLTWPVSADTAEIRYRVPWRPISGRSTRSRLLRLTRRRCWRTGSLQVTTRHSNAWSARKPPPGRQHRPGVRRQGAGGSRT